MKKFTILLNSLTIFVCLLVFGLQSCQKQESMDNESLKLINEVENLPNEVLRTTYSSLNANEKALLWNRHIDKVIASEKYVGKKLEHLNQLKALVSEYLFSKVGT